MKPSEQYPSSAYRRLNALEICPEKRVGIGRDVVFALSFPPAEASEEHLVVDFPQPVVVSLARAPRDTPVLECLHLPRL